MKRIYGWRRDTKEAKLALGRLYTPSRFKAIKYPDSFDLGTPPNPAFGLLNQGNLGACTAFALKRVAWWGLGLAALQQPIPAQAPEPSALFQYYNERQLDGDVDQDAGSTISQGVTALRQFGICAESDWPYDIAKFNQTPPTSAYQDATNFEALAVENVSVDVASIQDCLYNSRLPIAFGSDLFAQFESEKCAQDGIVEMPCAGASPIGGHAQCIRGWKTDSKLGLLFKINNSWGNWGDNGCDWMLLNYLQSYASDLWAIVKMK